MRINWLFRLLLASLLVTGLSACGFKLRGQSGELPPQWTQLAIEVRPPISAHSGLALALRQKLQQAHRAHIVTQATVGSPRIVIISEKYRNPVSALDALGRTQEFLHEYIVRYQFIDADGKALAPAYRLYLRREQSYSSASILSKERESGFLLNNLQQRAANRIIERLLAETR